MRIFSPWAHRYVALYGICQNVEAIEMFKTLGTTLSTNRNTACYDCIAMLCSERSMVIVNFLLFALFFFHQPACKWM